MERPYTLSPAMHPAVRIRRRVMSLLNFSELPQAFRLVREESSDWVMEATRTPTNGMADVSAIQLVGHQTTKEEIWDLYHQVYKLRRLQGSLPWRPEQLCKLTRDVVSSLKNHLQQRGGGQPRGCEELQPTDTHLPPDRASQRVRWGTSAKRELPEARDTHQWALAATTALEERIEWLSQSTTRSRIDSCIPSQSHN